jgi:hypothetical protein
MNLFRSEEHIRNWVRFDPAAEGGILPLSNLANLFSVKHFTQRLDPDYFSRGQYADDFVAVLIELGKTRTFWSP